MTPCMAIFMAIHVWRRGCLNELLDNQLEVPGFTADETKEIVEYLV